MLNSHQITDKLLQNWCELLQNFDINQTAAEKTFTQIAEAYSTPNRYYHNLEHIHHVLEVIQTLTLKSQTEDLQTETVQLAAWFHDIVYDTKAKDNEEKSAQYAVEFLSSLSIPPEFIKNVENMILATKHQLLNGVKQNSTTGDRLTQILLDADLAILSSNPEEYSKYAHAIRQEYIWVPETEYIAARKQILQNFLQRKNIYFTKSMQQTKDKMGASQMCKNIICHCERSEAIATL
ncbi:MAG: HD domain-containing protein [Cyanobacteria bacterium P01_C01_bin.38]